MEIQMSDLIPCILVVDDEAEIRDILTHLLEKEGFKVITAPDGHKAMEKICPVIQLAQHR